MAIILFSTTIVDRLGVPATQNVWLDVAGTQTVDEVGAMANAYLPLLDEVTDGQITGAELKWVVDLPGGLKTAPVADSNITIGLLQGWTQAVDVTHHPSTNIPAVAKALINDTTGKFDQANAAYLAWRNYLRGLDTDIVFISAGRRAITGVFRILESKRKHRKRTVELSYEAE